MNIIITYRDGDAPDEYRHCKVDLTTFPAVLSVTENLSSYGSRRTRLIPWDRIHSIVMES